MLYFILGTAAFLLTWAYGHHMSAQRYHQKPNTVQRDVLPSVLIAAKVSHRRFLPRPSRHTFGYSLLYIGVDLDSLIERGCDLPFRMFKYGTSFSLLGIKSAYHLLPSPKDLRQKLLDLLKEFDISDEQLGRVWLVTMPTLMGWQGPTPLTVWFCYSNTSLMDKGSSGRGQLLCVVLEVGAVPGESYAYVLKMDSRYRDNPAAGYDLAFTFPRGFHVSPFNARNGFYRVDLADPFCLTRASPLSSNSEINGVQLKISIRLLTPEKDLKLLATLHSRAAPIPLHAKFIRPILLAIAKAPLALTFTVARTFYQAYILHYLKRLPVYPQAEPVTPQSRVMAEGALNPPEKDVESIGRPMRFIPSSSREKKARRLVEGWARARGKESGVGLRVDFTDSRKSLRVLPSGEQSKADFANDENAHNAGHNMDDSQVLSIKTSDSNFFLHLLTAASPEVFLALAPERVTSISSPELFAAFVSAPTPSIASGGVAARFNRYFRCRLAHDISKYSSVPFTELADNVHLTDHRTFSDRERREMALLVFGAWFENRSAVYLAAMLRVRYVRGFEPWLAWDRGTRRRNLDNIQVEEQETEMDIERYE